MHLPRLSLPFTNPPFWRFPLRILLLAAVLLTPMLLTPMLAHATTTPTEAVAIAAAQQDHTAYTLPAAELVKAHALAQIGTFEFVAGTLWGILVAYLLLQLGIATRMRNVAVNLSKRRWVQCAVFVLELLIIVTLLGLPLRIYGHSVGLAYGLSLESWVSWTADLLKSFVIEYIVGYLLVLLLFWRIRRSPRMWWLQMALLVWVASIAGTFLTPYLIDPLFNHFEPLARTNPALVEQLERVVARGHAGTESAGISIPPDRMFLMKASDKTTTLNAYVTGFGASQRVVVWDTSLRKGTQDDILFIFGHEMGHYVLGHIVLGVWLTLAFLLPSFFVAYCVLGWLLARFGGRWRIPVQDHWAVLVVLILVLRVLYVCELPLISAISRSEEHAADVYGQEVVHGIVTNPQQTGQQSFDLLGQASLDDPAPQPFEFWYDSHPTTAFRAAFARIYAPWSAGNAPKYFKK